MADLKISALTAATTPLAGTEVLPIVQSGATVKVSVDNLTTGKIVYGLRFAGNISNPNSYAFNGDTNIVAGDTTGNATWSLVSSTTGIGYLAFADGTSGTARFAGRIDYNHSTNSMGFYTNGGVEAQVIDSSQNVTVSVGNLVFGTAAKGIFGSSPFSVAIANGAAGTILDLSVAMPAGSTGIVNVYGASAGKATILCQRDQGGYYSVTELGTQPRGTYITSISLSGTNLRITNSSGGAETFSGRITLMI